VKGAIYGLIGLLTERFSTIMDEDKILKRVPRIFLPALKQEMAVRISFIFSLMSSHRFYLKSLLPFLCQTRKYKENSKL